MEHFHKGQNLSRTQSLVGILILFTWMTLISANPAPFLVRLKRENLEMGGMYFHEDYSGAPGSGGGVTGPVYLCGYAGSSPDDFDPKGTSIEPTATGDEKSNPAGHDHAAGQGKSSASASAPKLLPIPSSKPATAETVVTASKPKILNPEKIIPDTASDKIDTGSQYYLRPHILHMPRNRKSTKQLIELS